MGLLQMIELRTCVTCCLNAVSAAMADLRLIVSLMVHFSSSMAEWP